jgi:tRNA-modifying protein YgfZ
VTDVTPEAERVLVEGPDAHPYLDSQCTQDLADQAVDEDRLTLLLDPSGVLVTVAVVGRVAPDAFALEVPVGTGERAVARLQRFAIRADLSVRSPVPVGHSVTFSALERIDAGIPGAAELVRDLVPHALSTALRERTVSFTKGCYPGQELVARMQARGASPPYVLRGLSTPAPIGVGDPVGDPRFDGAVTSVLADPLTGGSRALCVLHRRDAAMPTIEVRAGSGIVVARLH